MQLQNVPMELGRVCVTILKDEKAVVDDGSVAMKKGRMRMEVMKRKE